MKVDGKGILESIDGGSNSVDDRTNCGEAGSKEYLAFASNWNRVTLVTRGMHKDPEGPSGSIR